MHAAAMKTIQRHFFFFSNWLLLRRNLMDDILSNMPIKTSNWSYTTHNELNCRCFFFLFLVFRTWTRSVIFITHSATAWKKNQLQAIAVNEMNQKRGDGRERERRIVSAQAEKPKQMNKNDLECLRCWSQCIANTSLNAFSHFFHFSSSFRLWVLFCISLDNKFDQTKITKPLNFFFTICTSHKLIDNKFDFLIWFEITSFDSTQRLLNDMALFS